MSDNSSSLDDAVHHNDASHHTEQPPLQSLNSLFDFDSNFHYDGPRSSVIDGEPAGAFEFGVDVRQSRENSVHPEFTGPSEDTPYVDPLASTSSLLPPQGWQNLTLNPHYLTHPQDAGQLGWLFLSLTPPESSSSEATTPSATSTSDYADSPSESNTDRAATPRVAKPFVASPAVVAASTSRRIAKSGRHYLCTKFPPCNASLTTMHNLKNHVNSHLGKKPHQCKFCFKRTVTRSDTKRHMRTCKRRT